MKTKKTMKLACAALAAVMTMGVVVGCGGAKNYAENNTEYVIGASGPLTGDYAIYGLSVKKGAELAVEEINAKNEDGMKFKFTIMDDKAGADDVPTNFSQLYESGMQVSLGCVTTGACLAFKPLAVDKNLFTLCPSATGDDVTKDAPNVYQMCYSDSNQGTVAAVQYFNTDQVPADAKLGILYDSSDAYSYGIYNNFIAALDRSKFPASGIKTATFTSDTKNDLTQQAENLKDCNYFFMPIYYSDAAKFIEKAKNKVNADAIFFGCDGFDGIDSMDSFDINAITQKVSMLSHFSATATDAKTAAFVAAYKAKYNNEVPIQFGASAYDCVCALSEAIKTAKAKGKDVPYTLSPEDMTAVLTEVFKSSEFKFSGVTTAGKTATWKEDGTVEKTAEIVVIKEVTAA